jgi:hypothetical protein
MSAILGRTEVPPRPVPTSPPNPDLPPSAFESAVVVRLRPGDVVLFRSPTRLSDGGRAQIVALLNEVFPAHESIVLEGGQDVAVLRPEPSLIARVMRRFSQKAHT